MLTIKKEYRKPSGTEVISRDTSVCLATLQYVISKPYDACRKPYTRTEKIVVYLWKANGFVFLTKTNQHFVFSEETEIFFPNRIEQIFFEFAKQEELSREGEEATLKIYNQDKDTWYSPVFNTYGGTLDEKTIASLVKGCWFFGENNVYPTQGINTWVELDADEEKAWATKENKN